MQVAQSCLTLCNPMVVVHQAPISMGFSRQEYWSGFPFPSSGDLPNPRTEPGSVSLQADSLPSEPPGNKQKDDFSVCYLFLRVVYHEMLKQVYKGDTTGFKIASRVRGPCKMPPITSQPVRSHQPATDRSIAQPTAVSQTGACKETLGSSEWACDASGTPGSLSCHSRLHEDDLPASLVRAPDLLKGDNMPATCLGKHTLETISLTTGLQVEHIQLRISKHLEPTFLATDALNPNQLGHE